MSQFLIDKQVHTSNLPESTSELSNTSQGQLNEEPERKPALHTSLKHLLLVSKITVSIKLLDIFPKTPKKLTDLNNLKSVPDKPNGVRNFCLRSRKPKPIEDPDYEFNSDSESDSSTTDVTTLVRRRGGHKGPYKCNYCHAVFSQSQNRRDHIIAKHIPSSAKGNDLQFQCITCKNVYTKCTTLNSHYIMHWDADKRPYPCTICTKSFACPKSLRQHSVSHSSKRAFKCKMCLQTFKRKYELDVHKSRTKSQECKICEVKFCLDLKYKQHMSTHKKAAKESEKFCCKICGDIIEGFQNKVAHMKRHFKDPFRYKCGFCPKKFRNISALESHIRLHTGEKPYKCKICNKHFTQKSNLSTHGKVHEVPNYKVQCLKCFKKYKDHGCLVTHQIMCGKEDDFIVKVPTTSTNKSQQIRYKCNVCPQSFKRKDYVQAHIMRFHLRLKLYQCPKCGMKFTSRHELQTHYRIHTNENPFKCDICGKEFKQSAHLKMHKVNHTDDRPFKCPQCPKAFKTSAAISGHIKLHTKELPYPCSFCSKEFPRGEVLKRHMNFHHLGIKEFECLEKDCGKRFVTRGELKLHARAHSDERPFPCTLCSTSFKSKKHFTDHCRSKSHMKLLQIEELKNNK